MNSIIRIIFFVLISIMTISSCTEEENGFEYAVIRDKKSPAVDGCGWVVDISSVIYKPVNLPSEFKIDELKVIIKYDTLGSEAGCGLGPLVFDEIYIIMITKNIR